MWTENESSQSSTWRELSVIEFALQSFASVLEGSHVKWFTDSQAAAKIVEVGSMKLGLHRMARRIFDICIRSGIHLEVQWIPRTMNQQADYISRFIDTDDWQLTDDFFLFLMVGGPIMLIVLPIIIIISSLNIFQGSGTPILRALIFSFSLFEERIAWWFLLLVLFRVFCII